MKYRSTVVILLFTAILSIPQVAAADEEVSFTWGFFLKSADGLMRSLDFEGQEPVVGGDLLRVYLQLHESSYVYLFLYDSRGDLYQVFPPSPDFYSYSFPTWQKYHFPSAREWFTLDDSNGVEKFFFLASDKRLADIEEMAKAVIFDRNGELGVSQAVEMIDKKTVALSSPKSVSIDPVQASYTAKPGSMRSRDGVSVNRTTASGPYSLVLELVNR